MEPLWTITGILAASLTSFGFVPQVRKMLRRKTVGDISPLTMLQLGAGNTLWLVYGIFRDDWVIIGANVVAISIFIAGLWLYYRYRVREAKG